MDLPYANYPTSGTYPTGTQVYYRFKVKYSGGLYPYASQLDFTILFNGTSCGLDYNFSDAEKDILADGNYHTFSVNAPAYPPCGQPASGNTMYFGLYAPGNAGTFTFKGNGTLAYLEVADAPLPPPYPIASSVSIDTPTNQTYVSNPITFSGTYDNIDTYNFIQFNLTYASSTEVLFDSYPLNLVNGGPFDWSTTRNLPYTGSYSVRARLFDSGTGSTTNWTDWHDFALGATTTNPYVNAPLKDCDTLDIACYVANAFVMVFKPSPSSVAQFYSLDDSLEKRAPFVYAYQVPELYNGLFTATPTASSTFTFTIRDWSFTFLSKSQLEAVPYSSTIKTILGWLMWFAFVQLVYYQVIRIHNKDTK